MRISSRPAINAISKNPVGVVSPGKQLLREPDGLRRGTGWGEAEWYLSPHALLHGAAPAAMLSADPARVMHAAQCLVENE